MEVQLLETFGSDLTVVNAARVSFAKESATFDDMDARLIKYLARNEHNSPFYHPQVRFRLKMPIFVAREWFRHTVGFARNEVSRRYVDSEPEIFLPAAEDIRERDSNKKQGSKDTAVPTSGAAHDLIRDINEKSKATYSRLLEMGVAPELARTVLPQGMYTEFIETGSLYAYARLCQLRMDSHAQKEIRDYAGAVSAIMSKAFPVSWAALTATTTATATATA